MRAESHGLLQDLNIISSSVRNSFWTVSCTTRAEPCGGTGSPDSCGGIIQKDQEPSKKSWGCGSSTSELIAPGEFVVDFLSLV